MDPKPHIIVAVKTLLLHSGRALLLQRGQNAPNAPGIWEFPGGKLDFGEDLRVALLREVREETGLEVTVGPLLYAESLMANPQRQVVVINYLSHAQSGAVTLSFEHAACHWATKEEMRTMLDGSILRNLDKNNILQTVDFSGLSEYPPFKEDAP